MLEKVNLNNLLYLLVVLFFVAGFSGCKQQSVKLNQEYKNKISEVVLILRYPTQMPMLSRAPAGPGMAASGGFIGGLVGGLIDANRVSHIKEIWESLNKIAIDEKNVSFTEKNIVNTVQSSLNVKVVRVVYKTFYDHEEVLAELGSDEVNTVMYVGFNMGFTPGMSSVDMKMDVKLFTDMTGGSYVAKIHAGGYYYQTLPAATLEIENAKDNLKSAIEKWKSDDSEEFIVPYPHQALRALEVQHAKYWAEDNGMRLRGAIIEGVTEITQMLKIDYSNDVIVDNNIIAFYRDYRGALSADDKMNNSLNGVLLEENENRRIIRGPYDSLFSVQKNMENMNDVENFDGYFIRM